MRLYVPPGERRPTPPLPEVDDRRPVALGTLAWVALFVLALVFRDDLTSTGRGWWIWTPLCGAGLGLFGLFYLHRRRGR